jgi:hypothetical protein
MPPRGPPAHWTHFNNGRGTRQCRCRCCPRIMPVPSGGTIDHLQLSSTHAPLAVGLRAPHPPGCGTLSHGNIQLSKSGGLLRRSSPYQAWASGRDRGHRRGLHLNCNRGAYQTVPSRRANRQPPVFVPDARRPCGAVPCVHRHALRIAHFAHPENRAPTAAR